MSLVFAVLTALTAAGAAFMVLDPLRRASRQPGTARGVTGGGDGNAPPSDALLVEIERDVRAIRTRGRAGSHLRGPRAGAGA